MRERTGAMAVMAAMILLAGCRIDSNKKGSGDDVKISTPFGGLQVKTDGGDVAEGIGLPVYPGATLFTKDKDKGAADVNLSFGSFQLKVKAVNFRSSDAPDKVEAFYRDGLKKYGDVIKCQGEKPVGTPTQTRDGLTCDTEHDNHVTVLELTGKKSELKAGSKLHQHLVTLESEGGGTKFALVALDLPGKMFSDDEKGSGQ